MGFWDEMGKRLGLSAAERQAQQEAERPEGYTAPGAGSPPADGGRRLDEAAQKQSEAAGPPASGLPEIDPALSFEADAVYSTDSSGAVLPVEVGIWKDKSFVEGEQWRIGAISIDKTVDDPGRDTWPVHALGTSAVLDDAALQGSLMIHDTGDGPAVVDAADLQAGLAERQLPSELAGSLSVQSRRLFQEQHVGHVQVQSFDGDRMIGAGLDDQDRLVVGKLVSGPDEIDRGPYFDESSFRLDENDHRTDKDYRRLLSTGMLPDDVKALMELDAVKENLDRFKLIQLQGQSEMPYPMSVSWEPEGPGGDQLGIAVAEDEIGRVLVGRVAEDPSADGGREPQWVEGQTVLHEDVDKLGLSEEERARFDELPKPVALLQPGDAVVLGSPGSGMYDTVVSARDEKTGRIEVEGQWFRGSAGLRGEAMVNDQGNLLRSTTAMDGSRPFGGVHNEIAAYKELLGDKVPGYGEQIAERLAQAHAIGDYSGAWNRANQSIEDALGTLNRTVKDGESILKSEERLQKLNEGVALTAFSHVKGQPFSMGVGVKEATGEVVFGQVVEPYGHVPARFNSVPVEREEFEAVIADMPRMSDELRAAYLDAMDQLELPAQALQPSDEVLLRSPDGSFRDAMVEERDDAGRLQADGQWFAPEGGRPGALRYVGEDDGASLSSGMSASGESLYGGAHSMLGAKTGLLPQGHPLREQVVQKLEALHGAPGDGPRECNADTTAYRREAIRALDQAVGRSVKMADWAKGFGAVPEDPAPKQRQRQQQQEPERQVASEGPKRAVAATPAPVPAAQKTEPSVMDTFKADVHEDLDGSERELG